MQNNALFTFIYSKLNRRRTFAAVVALGVLIGLVAMAAFNATATPRSTAEMQMAGWVNDLKSDGLTTQRQQAQRNLELAGEAAVPQLVVALRSDSTAQRRNAADMLGYIASPQATTALQNVLRTDTVPAVRRNAAWALGEIQDARAINDLQQASITDRSEMVRGASADSLARIRTTLAKNAQVNEQLIGAYASSPSVPNLVYVAAKRDLSVSQDGGKTWTTVSNALPSQASALAVNPTNAQELYLGVEAMGIYKSSDGGKTWSAINSGITLTPGARDAISAIAIDPENANVLYLAHGVWLGTGQVSFYPIGLLSSHDGGKTWQELSAGTSTDAISKLAFRDGQLYGLAGSRVLTLMTPRE